MTACWKRPSLTGLEILWRWAFGAPAGALLVYEALKVWSAAPVDAAALKQMSILDPMGTAATLSDAAGVLISPILQVAAWLAPVLLAVWVIVSSLGRAAVLRRADARMHARPWTLMTLQALRVAALGMSFVTWFVCLQAAGRYAVNDRIAAGQEPNLVAYFALAIVATLGMFTVWAVASWVLSVAPLLAMLRDLGTGASLKAAFRLGPLRTKLVEINLVMGIVKIGLAVLAIAFSACPLPFTAIATPEFMLRWYCAVTVVYLVASDFFHVVWLMSYLDLWKAYEGGTV